MNQAEVILVIILSSTLAIFLILSIIIAIKTIEILDHLKAITAKAENFADKAEAVGEMIQKSAGPLALGRLVLSIADTVLQKKRSNKNSKEDEDA